MIKLDVFGQPIEEFNLPPISDEQTQIVNAIKSGNVSCNCIAGSGKTTSILYIANKYPDLRILVLTYNKKLKEETMEKVEKLNLDNTEVRSYHAFVVRYYTHRGYRDPGIIDTIKYDLKPKNSFSYDLIIIDEIQDINNFYYELLCKIYKDNQRHSDNHSGAKICILGDTKQSIYGFKGADPRFITYANKLFNFNAIPWSICPLSETFRMTIPTTKFVNRCILGEDRIRSNKKSCTRPIYLLCNAFGNDPYKYVLRYLLLKDIKVDDIFILAPSVKKSKNKSSPIRILANKLSNNGYPIYIPGSDDIKLDEKVLENKIVFSTYHQIKGLERKVVIIFNFDKSYFTYYAKRENPNVCPNTIYVATTRSLEHLLVIHHKKNKYLPFVKRHLLRQYCRVIGTYKEVKDKPSRFKTDIGVTDLINHVPSELLYECFSMLKITNAQKKSEKIAITSTIKDVHGYENIGDINGVVIPTYCDLILNGKITILDIMLREIKDKDPHELVFDDIDTPVNPDKYDIRKINIKKLTVPELLFIVNKYQHHSSKFVHRMNQITKYDWLSKETLYKCTNRLIMIIDDHNSTFEVPIDHTLNGILIRGFIDVMDNVGIYELKCVSELSIEHYIQLAIYMYLWMSNHRDKREFYLYNIITDELNQIECEYETLKDLIGKLVHNKFYMKSKENDTEFIDRINLIKKKYIKI